MRAAEDTARAVRLRRRREPARNAAHDYFDVLRLLWHNTGLAAQRTRCLSSTTAATRPRSVQREV
jgi:hypothetical protein